MAKATRADTAAPETVPDTAPLEGLEVEPAPVADEPLAAWPRWLFTGTTPLTYPAASLTAQPGDVVAYPHAPAADGRWEATDLPVTDIHRPEPADAPEEG